MCCSERPVDQVGVLLVRVWLATDAGLCARVMTAEGPLAGEATWATCTGTDATVRAVRSWLEQWYDDARPRARDGPASPQPPQIS
ncbi:hypothetical protein CLV35_3290 [Motilibacter peucedani]|uniref:Uncharacterized protein n=1 Tax=Motilibacter peucedani TaxID=598650 RepID=A0A420XMG3_9ACTN|nr:hypothetical protein [Motilibacter peucedani]RKS71490.1 hypothetical protein CLV35_3290 [Motilibacter peucedani]